MLKNIKGLFLGLTVMLLSITSGYTARFGGGGSGSSNTYTDPIGATWAVAITTNGILYSQLSQPIIYPSSLSINPISTMTNTVFVSSATLSYMGNGISSRTINFTYNRSTNTAVTNSYGVASSTFMSSGSYGYLPLTASFLGDTTSNLTSDYIFGGCSTTTLVGIIYIPPPPPVTSLLSPANECSSTNTLVNFSWTAVVDSNSAISSYTVLVATSSSFYPITYSSATSLTSASITILASATTNYWRVDVQDSVGQTAIGTSTQTFVISSIVIPDDAIFDCTFNSVNSTYNDVAGATIGTSNGGANVVDAQMGNSWQSSSVGQRVDFASNTAFQSASYFSILCTMKLNSMGSSPYIYSGGQIGVNDWIALSYTGTEFDCHIQFEEGSSVDGVFSIAPTFSTSLTQYVGFSWDGRYARLSYNGTLYTYDNGAGTHTKKRTNFVDYVQNENWSGATANHTVRRTKIYNYGFTTEAQFDSHFGN